jgi:hypothetical protein
MPQYNNKKMKKKARAKAPKENLALRKPHQVVGSDDWASVQRYASGNTAPSDKHSYRTDKPKGANRELVEQIVGFVESGGWEQVNGGERHLLWVNDKHYPNQSFAGGKIVEHGTGNIYHFPIATATEDPKGIALHHQTYNGGVNYTVRPNIWKRHVPYHRKKRLSRNDRWEERRALKLLIEQLEREQMYDSDGE